MALSSASAVASDAGASDGLLGGSAAATKTNESLPDFAMGRISQMDLSRWTAKVMQHYKVPVCFLALEASTGMGMYLKGRHGIDTKYVSLPSMCYHGQSRELPIIVADAYECHTYRYDPLVAGPPKARLYLGAPLMVPRHRCIGTLCVMDAKPRSFFSLTKCAYLVECAKQIGALLHAEVESFMCATVNSLDRLRDMSVASSGSGSDGQHATHDSLESLETEQGGASSASAAAAAAGPVRTNESLVSIMNSRTCESLVAIPENDDLNVPQPPIGARTMESLASLDGDEQAEPEQPESPAGPELPADPELPAEPESPAIAPASPAIAPAPPDAPEPPLCQSS